MKVEPPFNRRVLATVPVLFQLAEWLLVIVAFQYVDVRYGYVAAKVAWIALGLAFCFYVGVLNTHVLWQITDPRKSRAMTFFGSCVLPLLGGLFVVGLQHLAKQMVAAQISG